MSSITRLMMGIPQLPGTKVRTKVKGKYIFYRATLPNDVVECSIIKKTPKGRELVKSVIMDKFFSRIHRNASNADLFVDKRTGKVLKHA